MSNVASRSRFSRNTCRASNGLRTWVLVVVPNVAQTVSAKLSCKTRKMTPISRRFPHGAGHTQRWADIGVSLSSRASSKASPVRGWKSYEMVLRYAHLAPEKLSSVAGRIERQPAQTIAVTPPAENVERTLRFRYVRCIERRDAL